MTPAERFTEARDRSSERHARVVAGALEAAGLAAIPALPRPVFLPATMLPTIERASEAIVSAVARVGRAYFSERRFEDRIPLQGRAAQLAQLDGRTGPILGAVRLDALVDPTTGDFWVLEVQAGDPSGAGWTDALLDAQRLTPAFEEVARAFRLHTHHLVDGHRRMMDALAPHRPGERTTVFLSEATAFIRTDQEAIARVFTAGGDDALVADPRELDFDGRRLRCQGRPISRVYRDTLDEFITEPFWDRVQPALRAYSAGAFSMLNPFAAAFADLKSVLEVLTDTPGFFSLEEQRALERHLLPTRVVEARRVDFLGQRVDLPAHIRTHRERLVMKPADGYGGFGVLVGPGVEQRVWEAKLDEALGAPNGWVVQPYRPLHRERFDGVDKRVVLSAWVQGGRFGGCFARASPGHVVNVHQGGGIGPVIFAATVP